MVTKSSDGDRNMKKKIIILAVVLGLVSGGAAAWFHFGQSEDSDRKVFVSGNIEAIEVDLAFRIGGQIKTLPIEEGDRIKVGQVVATLDTDTLLALKGGAEASITTAKAVLDELEEGTRKESIAMARAGLMAAKSRMKNAKDEYDRHLPLFKQGAISASTLDARETALKVATEDYNNAAERLRELETGPREQQIRAARGRLEQARWQAKKIELDLKHSLLKTPISGTILVKSNELGEVVLPGAPVATVAHTDEVWLKGYVAENDLGKIKLGQKVEVTTDTYPRKIYPGRITYISSSAEFTPKNVQTRQERIKLVYRIKVTIGNTDQELKIGMPAEGFVLLESPAKAKETDPNKGAPGS